MNVPRFGRKSLQICVPLLFYTAFVGLYALSFTKIWVYQEFVVDAAVQDADLFQYEALYGPVIALGSTVLLSFLLLGWWSWARKLMWFSHVLLGMFALAYCGNLWANVDRNFHLLYSDSWFISGAELGPGFFLFFSSVVCLIFGALCSLMLSIDVNTS